MNRNVGRDVPATSRVVVVDDDPAVTRSLSRLLRSEGYAGLAFRSPREFLDRVHEITSGCILLDVAMPEMSGLEVQKALAARGCEIPIVFLTGHGEVPMCANAMKDGAVDFLTKPVDRHDLLRAIESALELDRRRLTDRAEKARDQALIALLTPRETEVFRHVVSGLLNKQIAFRLGTVEKTIKVHRGRVMEKLEAESVADLVRLAERAGIHPV